MSLLPLILSNLWEDMEQPHRLLDQHFGIGINPDSLLQPLSLRLHGIEPNREKFSRCLMSPYCRPWGQLLRKNEDGSSTVKADKDKFQVVLDVLHFAPEEINVKVVDRFVVVEGKHEEKQDEHGWISRQFSRKYIIPEQCDIDQVTSKLSSDGVLTISVPRKPKETDEGERIIHIEHTGKPAAIRNAPAESKKDEEKKEEES
ncbi:hypothetical protein KPH14_002853 [Odynerus spinipes]|uniref:SHSP domain-containing protein n=1 Tax=Odynerus spinipes TaxID=1348599 RepID=A0AAD9RW84_9HYME|nr:hypothetical protein KPH14_002853 [Odynerus spinipes]